MALRTVIALGAAVVALTGSATVGPWSSPDAFRSTDPTASRSAQPLATGRIPTAKLKRVDAVELDAEAMVLRDDGRTVGVLSMRDRRVTTSALSRMLGTAASTHTADGDGGACLPAATTLTWDGALRVAALQDRAALGNELEVRVLASSVRSRTGQPITLTGPDDVRVGEDVHDRIVGADPDLRDDLGTPTDPAWQLLLGRGWPSDDPDDGSNGVSALTDGTVVTVIGSPMPVHATRSC